MNTQKILAAMEELRREAYRLESVADKMMFTVRELTYLRSTCKEYEKAKKILQKHKNKKAE